jgi:alpha-tubulin suppressor-like RCC1 family protein
MGSALSEVELGPERARTVAAGGAHTCAVLTGGQVKCWGANGQGQLGLGDRRNRGRDAREMGSALPLVELGRGRTATAITAGQSHTCALLDSAAIKCWGANDFGQLGLGDGETRGDDPADMGDALPTVDLGSGRSARAVTAGAYHTCALLDDGQVKCWGANDFGQLGLGDVRVRGLAPIDLGDSLLPAALPGGRSAVAVRAGGAHTCALLEGGDVACWGTNNGGQLGLGDRDRRGDDKSRPPAIVELGPGRKAVALALGADHSCALFASPAELRCWGLNLFGQLGLGDDANRGDAPSEAVGALPPLDLGEAPADPVVAVTAGLEHTCALFASGTVKCWGANGRGQLGRGDKRTRGTAPADMGRNLIAIEL